MFFGQRKKYWFNFSVILISTAILILVGSATFLYGAEKQTKTFQFLLSPVGGGPYAIGFAFSDVMKKNHDWMRLSPVETPGAVYLIKALNENKEAFGIGGSLENGAKLGTLKHEDFRPDEKVAGIMKLKPLLKDLKGLTNYCVATGLFVTLDANIKTPQDMIGKKIGFGKITQNFYAFMPYVFLREGWGIADKVEIKYISEYGAVNALVDGLVDVAFVAFNSGVSNGQASDILPNDSCNQLLLSGRKLHFIKIDKAALDRMNQFTGWHLPALLVTAGSIKFLDKDTYGISSAYGFGCHKDMPLEDAYEFTKCFVQYQKAIGNAHALAKVTTRETYTFGYKQSELHPGAVKAYEELGIPFNKE